MTTCVIGLDLGTTGCKAALYTMDGILLAKSYRRNTMLIPASGLVEQSPDEWWENSCACIKEVLHQAAISGEAVAGVAISCAGGILAVDAKGNPLTNIIMQIDQRAAGIHAKLEKLLGNRAFETGKNTLSGGVSNLPNAVWLREERPELYKKTQAFLMPNSYIVHKLTGELVGDVSRCATILLMDIKGKCWVPHLCEAVGIDIEKLPRLLRSHQIAGTVTAEAAEKCGLAAGTIVAAGLMDTAAACIGAGVLENNDACLILGTFGKLCVTGDGRAFDPGFINCCYLNDDSYLSIAVIDGGCGLALNWFLDTFAPESTGDDRYRLWDGMAAAIPPEESAPLYLPFLSGGRSPEWDASTYSTFFDIKRHHGRAHFYRAILEGIAFSARYNMDIIAQRTGRPICSLRASGGGSKSDIWLQILADIIGVPVIRMANPDTEAAGAALIAAKAIRGSLPTWDFKEEELFIPNECYMNLYSKRYAQYCELRAALVCK